ncbi:MAG: hypothetical protein ACOYN9_01200 [Saprospiraceae bacterium]|jgi:hypothetical protein
MRKKELKLEELQKKLKVVKIQDLKKVTGGKQTGGSWNNGCGGIIPL